MHVFVLHGMVIIEGKKRGRGQVAQVAQQAVGQLLRLWPLRAVQKLPRFPAQAAKDLAYMRRPLESVQEVESSAALLKAFLVNGAVDLAPGQYGSDEAEIPPAPNDIEGWGRIDVEPFNQTGSWMKVLDDKEGMRLDESRVFRIEVASGNELRVTLAWSDYPSLPEARLQLVNDLDLRVVGPDGSVYYPNGRDSRDPLNNVERIVLDISGSPGDYTIELDAWNVPFSPQPFALVAQVL